MHKIPIETRRFDEPTRVVIEASLDVVLDQGLDTLDGEQFDTIEAVILIEAARSEVTFETVRTIEAWKRGEPNAGRGRRTLPRDALAAIWI